MVEENELILVSVSVLLGKINSKPISSQVQTKMVAVESKIRTHLNVFSVEKVITKQKIVG